MMRQTVTTFLLAAGLITLASCSTGITGFSGMGGGSSPMSASSAPVNTQGFPNDPTFWQGNAPTIWNRLQHIPTSQLQSASASGDTNANAWIKLAVISKAYSTDNAQLMSQLISWRSENPSHPGNELFPDNGTLTSLQNIAPSHHIALILPLQGAYASSGQQVRDGFLSAYYGSSAKNAGQQVSFVDINQSASVTAAYQEALSQGADTIVGPLTKDQVQTLLSRGNFPVPTLALNYTDLWFGSLPTNFYEFGLSPMDESQQVAEKSWSDKHTRALLIAPQDAWGQRVSKTLITRWEALGGKIVDSLYFNDQTDFNTSIPRLLHSNPNSSNNSNVRQRRQDFDVIFLLASPTSARQIVPLLRYNFADNVPIYATSSVYTGKPSPQQDNDLNGVIFTDTPWTIRMNNTQTATKSSGGSNRLSAVGRDAYLLCTQLPRLSKMPNFPLYGATGALTLTPQHLIYRRLPWAQMHAGQPQS